MQDWRIQRNWPRVYHMPPIEVPDTGLATGYRLGSRIMLPVALQNGVPFSCDLVYAD